MARLKWETGLLAGAKAQRLKLVGDAPKGVTAPKGKQAAFTRVSVGGDKRLVSRRNQTRRIAIHCISIGTDSDLLKQLAAANGGKYVRR